MTPVELLIGGRWQTAREPGGPARSRPRSTVLRFDGGHGGAHRSRGAAPYRGRGRPFHPDAVLTRRPTAAVAHSHWNHRKATA